MPDPSPFLPSPPLSRAAFCQETSAFRACTVVLYSISLLSSCFSVSRAWEMLLGPVAATREP